MDKYLFSLPLVFNKSKYNFLILGQQISKSSRIDAASQKSVFFMGFRALWVRALREVAGPSSIICSQTKKSPEERGHRNSQHVIRRGGIWFRVTPSCGWTAAERCLSSGFPLPRVVLSFSCARVCVELLAPNATPVFITGLFFDFSAYVPLHAAPLAVQRRAYAARVF